MKFVKYDSISRKKLAIQFNFLQIEYLLEFHGIFILFFRMTVSNNPPHARGNTNLDNPAADPQAPEEEVEAPPEPEPDPEALIAAFPIAKLTKLEELISNPRWVIPVLPKGELEVLLDCSIGIFFLQL